MKNSMAFSCHAVLFKSQYDVGGENADDSCEKEEDGHKDAAFLMQCQIKVKMKREETEKRGSLIMA